MVAPTYFYTQSIMLWIAVGHQRQCFVNGTMHKHTHTWTMIENDTQTHAPIFQAYSYPLRLSAPTLMPVAAYRLMENDGHRHQRKQHRWNDTTREAKLKLWIKHSSVRGLWPYFSKASMQKPWTWCKMLLKAINIFLCTNGWASSWWLGCSALCVCEPLMELLIFGIYQSWPAFRAAHGQR